MNYCDSDQSHVAYEMQSVSTNDPGLA